MTILKIISIIALMVFLAIIIGSLISAIFMISNLLISKYEPKEQEDIELENAWINEMKVEDAELICENEK